MVDLLHPILSAVGIQDNVIDIRERSIDSGRLGPGRDRFRRDPSGGERIADEVDPDLDEHEEDQGSADEVEVLGENGQRRFTFEEEEEDEGKEQEETGQKDTVPSEGDTKEGEVTDGIVEMSEGREQEREGEAGDAGFIEAAEEEEKEKGGYEGDRSGSNEGAQDRGGRDLVDVSQPQSQGGVEREEEWRKGKGKGSSHSKMNLTINSCNYMLLS
jgi:hypothetical protein